MTAASDRDLDFNRVLDLVQAGDLAADAFVADRRALWPLQEERVDMGLVQENRHQIGIFLHKRVTGLLLG